MEIEIANIAYISNRPDIQNSPNREYPLLLIPFTHQNHTTGSDTRATTSRTRWNYNKPSKKLHQEEHTPTTSQQPQTTSESVTQGKRKRTEHSDNDDQTASDDDVKKKE
jgi:hypothetical protein